MMIDSAKTKELSELANKLKCYFWSEVKVNLRHRHFRGPLTCRLNIFNSLRFFITWYAVQPLFKRGSINAFKALKNPSETLSSNMDCFDSGDRCGDTYVAFRFKKIVNELISSENLKD